MEIYETLSEAITALVGLGYVEDFNLMHDRFTIHGHAIEVLPGEVVIDHVFRFEGMTDPADEAVLYAISVSKHGIKGIFVDGYGISSDAELSDLIRELPIMHDEEH